MKLIKKLILPLLPLALTACTTYLDPNVNFEEIPPEKFTHEFILDLNNSYNEIIVVPTNGIPKLKLVDGESDAWDLEGELFIKRELTLRLPNGILEGGGVGEHGGGLTFTPNDKSRKPISAESEGVAKLFVLNGKIYALTASTHMANMGGHLSEVEIFPNEIKLKELMSFEDGAEVAILHGETLYVAAVDSFYAIKDFKQIDIIKEMPWSGLYPSTMAFGDDGSIFVGMRAAYVTINLKENSFKFFKYKEK